MAPYEVYDDDGAFDFHMSTPHHRHFAAAAEPPIDARSVRRLARAPKQEAAGRTNAT